MDQDATLNHFTTIATTIIEDLTAKGILDLKRNETTDEPLDIHSKDGQALIKALTLQVYDGVVKEMNPHRAPDLPQSTSEQDRQKAWRDANYSHPVPGPGRRG